MKIDVMIKYDEGYLPTKRHRKLRYREVEEVISIDIPEISKKVLVPAFGIPENYKRDEYTVYAYDNRLWKEVFDERYFHVPNKEKPMTPIEALRDISLRSSRFYGRWTGEHNEEKDVVMNKVDEYFSKLILVDGKLFAITSEPLYCIYTFGLGHNHAAMGTSLSHVWGYNPNISHESYFNVLQYDEAVKKALSTAECRGDTDSLDYIRRTKRIKVYDKKFVHRNPLKDHGDGNEVLNNMEKMISSSSSSLEAGALVLAGALAGI